jgi:branched-chain amino acid transport system permease protein
LRRHERVFLLLVVFLVVILAGYPAVGSGYGQSVLRDALIFGLLALSLDFFWGRTGLLSFGHSAFFGVGAYAMAIVTLDWGGAAASLVGLLAAVGLATLMAALVGYFLFFGEVRGAYFTIVTLAIALILQQAAISWVAVTGGDSGRIGVPPLSVQLMGEAWSIGTGEGLYYFVGAVSVLALAALWLACRAPYGQILRAIADNEQRVRALGHDTSLYILVNFMISGGLAGLAGAIYVSGSGYIAPDSVGLLLSTEVIVWVVVGGRGTLLGPFIGAFVALRLQQEISSLHPSLWPLVLGLIFVGIVFLFPEGMLPLIGRLSTFIGRERRERGSG